MRSCAWMGVGAWTLAMSLATGPAQSQVAVEGLVPGRGGELAVAYKALEASRLALLEARVSVDRALWEVESTLADLDAALASAEPPASSSASTPGSSPGSASTGITGALAAAASGSEGEALAGGGRCEDTVAEGGAETLLGQALRSWRDRSRAGVLAGRALWGEVRELFARLESLRSHRAGIAGPAAADGSSTGEALPSKGGLSLQEALPAGDVSPAGGRVGSCDSEEGSIVLEEGPSVGVAALTARDDEAIQRLEPIAADRGAVEPFSTGIEKPALPTPTSPAEADASSARSHDAGGIATPLPDRREEIEAILEPQLGALPAVERSLEGEVGQVGERPVAEPEAESAVEAIASPDGDPDAPRKEAILLAPASSEPSDEEESAGP